MKISASNGKSPGVMNICDGFVVLPTRMAVEKKSSTTKRTKATKKEKKLQEEDELF